MEAWDFRTISMLVTALAATLSAFFSWRVVKNWRDEIRESAENECLSIVENLRGAIGRFRSLCQENWVNDEQKWSTYRSAWDVHRELRMRLAVVRRYKILPQTESSLQAMFNPLRQMSDGVRNPKNFAMALADDAAVTLSETLLRELKERPSRFS